MSLSLSLSKLTKKKWPQNSVMDVIRASRPTFRSSRDKVAYAIHASFLVGYVLTATGPHAFADDALFSTSTGSYGELHQLKILNADGYL